MRSSYKTTQRAEILECLSGAHGHMTAAAVGKYLAEHGRSVSTATIYRQLEKLVEEGAVVKATPEGERSAFFELVDKASCFDAHCYHLKCESCGKLIHLDCGEVEGLCAHMLKHHGFQVDMRRTVIFGKCKNCSEGGNANAQ